jgi:ergothioneine biosynthesis protein EgtB
MPTQSANQTGTSAQASLLGRFRQVRAATLAFTAPLSPEDMMVQSSADASPIKWHLAHTSWFFETFILTPFAPAYKPFHPDFHWLFNSYYTSLGDMPAKNLRSSFSRPPLDDILAYRTHVDAAIQNFLSFRSEAEESAFRTNEDDILRRLALGLEHEQQHLELIATDIKHALFTNPLQPAYQAVPPLGGTRHSKPHFVSFEGGLVDIGVTPDPNDPLSFCFDNETPRHKVFLQPFELAHRLVTVREYLAFIDDNGYSRPELWLSEGWTTCRTENWQAPLYWTPMKENPLNWVIFTLSGFRSLDELAESPVCHLSFFEADAFARWSGCRLPTEFEWEHAAVSLSLHIYPWIVGGLGVRATTPHPASLRPYTTPLNMLESNELHPTHCTASCETVEECSSGILYGLQQMFGDVWEWTGSGYTGYPGYKPLPGALGEYNGKFMSSQVILRGGSCVTPAPHIRATYRNFFSPSTRWQFSGLRLAKDAG